MSSSKGENPSKRFIKQGIVKSRDPAVPRWSVGWQQVGQHHPALVLREENDA